MLEHFPFSSVQLPELIATGPSREELGDSLLHTCPVIFQGSSSWGPGLPCNLWVLGLKLPQVNKQKVVMTVLLGQLLSASISPTPELLSAQMARCPYQLPICFAPGTLCSSNYFPDSLCVRLLAAP